MTAAKFICTIGAIALLGVFALVLIIVRGVRLDRKIEAERLAAKQSQANAMDQETPTDAAPREDSLNDL